VGVGAHMGRLGEERGQLAGVDGLLAVLAALEQLEALAVEGAVQLGEELEGLGGEDLCKLRSA